MSRFGTNFSTLRWRNGALELLDQRVLPMRVEYARCASADDVAGAIQSMVVRGAPAIGCAAAYGVALASLRIAGEPPAAFFEQLDAAIERLAASRPTAVNLAWALQRMRARLNTLRSATHAEIAQGLLDEAHAITAEDIRVNRVIGAHGAALLAREASVLTHCNAGALATAGHGTALGVIRSAFEQGKRIAVYANETRPFLQGARLTAWELQRDGIPVTLIADNAAGLIMRRGNIDAVIVGADRVAANGDVANKIGTYGVAVLARRHGIPFYVAAPLSTLDVATASGEDIPIEERSPDEVTGYGAEQWAAPGVAVSNPVFDITPAELVTALICERGVVHAPNRAALAKLKG